MVKWTLALLLMSLYQYGVYSLFWTNANAVSDVKNIQHYSGSVSRIECVTITKIHGATNDRVYIKLKEGPELSFLDRGRSRQNCNDFYEQLVGLLLESKRSLRPLETEILGRFYPELKFEGYFLGAAPMLVNLNGQEWINFPEQKEAQRGFALFLSLTPIFCILLVRFGLFVQKLNSKTA